MYLKKSLEGKGFTTLLGIFLIYFLLTKIPFFEDPLYRGIIVSVAGEVGKEGVYSIPINTPTEQIVKKIKVNRLSDLSSFSNLTHMSESCSFTIPRKKSIRVAIRGAVHPSGFYTLPASATIKDLPKYLDLDPEVDKKFFKSRKKIYKLGEIIIPFLPNQ